MTSALTSQFQGVNDPTHFSHSFGKDGLVVWGQLGVGGHRGQCLNALLPVLEV